MVRFGEHTEQDIIAAFSDITELEVAKTTRPEGPGPVQPDLVLKAANQVFIIEFKNSSYPQQIVSYLQYFQLGANNIGQKEILLAVPFMGPGGAALCKQYGINWFDLSGNANISAHGIKIRIEGKPNKYKKAGRKPNLFAPKSARVIRHLLLHPHDFISQRDLAWITAINEGHVSNLIKKLESLQLIERGEERKIRPSNPSLLLEAWHETYDIKDHRIIKGHIASRTGDQLIKKVADVFINQNIPYWTTGLAAAWQYTHFAAFRIVSLYLKEPLEDLIINDLGFMEEVEGPNIWFIIPNDIGVLEGERIVNGVMCVNPLQTYLDLKGHPERSKEAAEELKKQHLRWNSDDD